MDGGGGSRGSSRYRATHGVSFVLYNPLRYYDPSGHKACDGEFADDCNGGNGIIHPHSYNITFTGTWDDAS
jgi:hypothetical protein